MRTPAWTVWGCLGALLSLGLVSGCTIRGGMYVETPAADPVYVAWSETRPDAEGLWVTGVVRRSDRVGSPIPVTVSVEVVSPSGAIADAVQSDRLDVPCRRTDRVQSFQRFTVRLPRRPQDGSSLRITPRCG